MLRRNLNNGDKNVGDKQDALWINAIVALSDLGRGGLGGGGKYSFIQAIEVCAAPKGRVFSPFYLITGVCVCVCVCVCGGGGGGV